MKISASSSFTFLSSTAERLRDCSVVFQRKFSSSSPASMERASARFLGSWNCAHMLRAFPAEDLGHHVQEFSSSIEIPLILIFSKTGRPKGPALARDTL